MLIEKKTEELEGLGNDHGVELSKMKQRHNEEMAKLKQVQIIEAKSMACRHGKEIEKTTICQADEQKNYVTIHAKALDLHATALGSLKEEFIQLKNKQVSSAINVHIMSCLCCIILSFSMSNCKRLALIFQISYKQSSISLCRGIRPMGLKTPVT